MIPFQQTDTAATDTGAGLTGCASVRLGVLPMVEETFIARRVELILPTTGVSVAYSGAYRCRVDRQALEIRTGDLLACRWERV